MDKTVFNNAIIQFFRDTYCVEYISDFDVQAEYDGDIYRFTAQFRLNQQNKPITISGQFETIEQFTTFAINELRQRRFPTVDYFKLIHEESQEEKKFRLDKESK